MPVEQTDKILKISLPSQPLTSVEIYYYGATVTSWKVKGEEKLFLSGKAHLDGSKAIRGGIPICWPVFGPPPSADSVSDGSLDAHSKLSQHGFARNYNWTYSALVMDRDEGVSVRFTLDPNPSIAAIFPHPFHLTYVVTLTAHQLSTDLHVVNPSLNLTSGLGASSVTAAATSAAQAVTGANRELKFQALLHTYLKVEDASKIQIKGLKQGLEYVDKVKGGEVTKWDGGDLKIEGEVDRVYRDVGSDDIILDEGNGKQLKVHRVDFTDCVTWNPQQATGSNIADMESGGWNHYVCIEPGYVKEFKTLQPGEEWIGQQVLSVVE